jgi:HSP20 family protein
LLIADKEDIMNDIAKRQPGRQLSEWFDWFDAGWPSLTEMWRGAFHPIRIEDQLESDRYVIRAELPGIDPEKDVEVTVENGVLSLSAERQERSSEKGRSEFRYGSFRRRVTLPQGAQEDAVEANYRDGILEISVPISATGSMSRSIPVRSQEGSRTQVTSQSSMGAQPDEGQGSESQPQAGPVS